jgi:hypothetical protein
MEGRLSARENGSGLRETIACGNGAEPSEVNTKPEMAPVSGWRAEAICASVPTTDAHATMASAAMVDTDCRGRFESLRIYLRAFSVETNRFNAF